MTVISSPGPKASQSKVVPLSILWITGQFNETDNHSMEYKECLSLRSEWCIGIFGILWVGWLNDIKSPTLDTEMMEKSGAKINR